MAIRTLDDRIAKYAYAVNPVRVGEDFAAKKTQMVNNMTMALAELSVLEERVKGILSGEAVLTVDYTKYHSFAREVWKKQKRFGGGSGLVDETAVLLAKWKARGCTEAVLDKLRNEIFAIPAPAGP